MTIWNYLAIVVIVLACFLVFWEKARRDREWQKKVAADARKMREEHYGEHIRRRLDDANKYGKFQIETSWFSGNGYTLLVLKMGIKKTEKDPVVSLNVNCLRSIDEQLTLSPLDGGKIFSYPLNREDVNKAASKAISYMTDYPSF